LDFWIVGLLDCWIVGFWDFWMIDIGLSDCKFAFILMLTA